MAERKAPQPSDAEGSALAEMFSDQALAAIESEREWALITGLAAMTGVDAAALTSEIFEGSALATAVSRLLGLREPSGAPVDNSNPEPGRRRGRPPELHRDVAVYAVIRRLMENGLTQSEAIKKASKILFKQGIDNGLRPPAPLTPRSIRRILQRYPRVWFDQLPMADRNSSS